MNVIGKLILLAACGLLPLLAASSESATQSANGCGADEIHWTSDGQESISFDWRGEAGPMRYGLTPNYGQFARGTAPNPNGIAEGDD